MKVKLLPQPLNQFLMGMVIVLCSVGISIAKSFDNSEVTHIDYPGWFKESFYTLDEDLEDALANGKQGLMVLFTTEGCSYCDLFIRRSLGDPSLASIVQKNFVSIGMEIFDDTEMTTPQGEVIRVKEFAKKEGVEFSPTLLFYGSNGERILRIVGYQSPERFKMILDYLSGKYYRSESFHDYLKRLTKKTASREIRTSLIEDELFGKPPYALDRRRFPASQPLLVIFETVNCEECEDFHTGVLALKEVRDILMKFEIVRFDAGDNKTPVLAPNGSRITPLQWFQQSNFTRTPALLFFDERGNEVLSTDALVQRQRMMNSILFVLERAYEKGWTYQRFARSKGIERYQKKQQ